MIRRRGAGLLSAALVFVVFGIFTLLHLPGTPYSGFRYRGAAAVPTGRTHAQGAQRVLGEEGGGVAPARLDGDSPTESVDVDTDRTARETQETLEGSSPTETPEAGAGPWAQASETPSTASKANQRPVDTAAETSDDAPDVPSETLTAHPIANLIKKAALDSEALLSRQSTTFPAAVAEYHRRYNMPPPPLFDKWFAFAQSRNVSLIDEFDAVHDMFLPFWGLAPSTVRRRAAEALGYANNMQGVLVRGGKLASVSGGREWEREGLRDLLGGFVEWLPDMDLAFNALDEPRVVLPHEDLARLVKRGREAQARASAAPRAAFSAADLGASIPEVPTSRFVSVGRQSAWAIARMSCPPGSPARSLGDDDDEDPPVDIVSYCDGGSGSPLCFVANTTAQTDVCSTPSLARTHGFFDRPNAFSVAHDLVPIFSASKMSSFQDLIHPALWYWTGRVPYNASADVPWAEKRDQLYWRGSTTGGFSRWGGWRRHHRQRAVLHLNSDNPTTVLSHHVSNASSGWEVQASSVDQHAGLFNVSFSHIGQCDPGDCAAQRAALPLRSHDPQHAAFAHKLLLDLDGNAFSGRFQTFLRSASLVLKSAVFRDWSGGRVVPWRDYVPLSVGGDEWVEAARYLAGEGRELAEGMARRQAGGRAEMEVWFFRVLLEYARVIDDERENIGFSVEL